LHLADEVGLVGIVHDPGAGLLVGFVQKGGPLAGAPLDDDLDARFGQAARRVRHDGDAGLAGRRLCRDPHLHAGARV
jgi:hypothetical protein